MFDTKCLPNRHPNHYKKSMKKLIAITLLVFTFTSCQNSQTVTWETYTNEKYAYSFKYPSNGTVNADGMRLLEEGETIYAHTPETPKIFSVVVKDPQPYRDLNWHLELVEAYTKDLKTYVTEVWQMNEDNFGDIIPLKLRGLEAYEFTAEGTYKDFDNEYTLLQDYMYLFTKYEGLIYEIRYARDNRLAKKMLYTFRFH